MVEKDIKIDYETIGPIEQRQLIELAHSLGRVMTKEDYMRVVIAYKSVIDRLTDEAKKQGIEI